MLINNKWQENALASKSLKSNCWLTADLLNFSTKIAVCCNVSEIVANIQEAATSDKLGRLFAVVHIGGKQRKITTEDMLIINGFFPPDIGDKIRLEKVRTFNVSNESHWWNQNKLKLKDLKLKHFRAVHDICNAIDTYLFFLCIIIFVFFSCWSR